MLLNQKKEIPLVTDPEIARKTEHRLVELLFQSSAFALFPLMALGLGFWWILTLGHPYFWSSVWLAVFGGLQGLRLFHIRRFLSKPESERRSHKLHVKLFWLQAILATILWSVILIFFHGPEKNKFLSVYALVTGGIACIAISSLAHLPKIYPTYIIGMLIPISVYFLWMGSVENIFVGSIALLFLGVGAVLSRRMRRSVISPISLELNNMELAKILQKENLKAEQLNTTLRDEVDKREKTEKELMGAIQEVEAASKSKSDFLAVVSHEIRTPMNGIRGMFDLVMDTILDKLQRDYIETANRSAETLLRLLNDFLDFSKSDQGGLPLEKTAFQLKETLDEINFLMAGWAKKKGLNFSFDWDESAPDWVLGDPVRFRQIVGNLLSNAVKFTEKGEVKVALERNE